MKIDILTLFPEMCESVLNESIIGRARKSQKVELECHNIRDFANNKHNKVDDMPYGGGMGMVMSAEPIYNCYKSLYSDGEPKPHLIYLSPKGATLTQKKVVELSKLDRIVLLCGHYEGIDERIIELEVDEELSVGDYVVHANYGIGLFEGMQSVRIDGVTRDYITIRYAGTDKLFVPCERLELIGKYIGERDSDGKVKLSKMGGGEWTKTKNRAKSSAKDIAKELIAQGGKYKELYERIEHYFHTSRPYLNGNLTINDVVKVVYSNKVYISQAICHYTGRNFRQYVNYHRVMYSVELFRNNLELNVASLAEKSGFNNMVSYTMAFRLFMNETPSEWCRKERAKILKPKK